MFLDSNWKSLYNSLNVPVVCYLVTGSTYISSFYLLNSDSAVTLKKINYRILCLVLTLVISQPVVFLYLQVLVYFATLYCSLYLVFILIGCGAKNHVVHTAKKVCSLHSFRFWFHIYCISTSASHVGGQYDL